MTGGHPAVCLDLLQSIPTGEFNLRQILTTIHHVTKFGAAGSLFLEAWTELPNEAKQFLSDLLVKRHITAKVVPELLNQLIAMGLLKEATHGLWKYLTFRSWYVELLLRYRGAEIGITLPEKLSNIMTEMMPEIGIINRSAYEVLNDIENQVRNFIIIQAHINQKSRQVFS